MYYRNVQHYRNDSGADEGRITIWAIETGLRDALRLPTETRILLLILS